MENFRNVAIKNPGCCFSVGDVGFCDSLFAFPCAWEENFEEMFDNHPLRDAGGEGCRAEVVEVPVPLASEGDAVV